MNKDFPRIMTLLRNERGLSQKKVAADLGITQALLSHYENGKRACRLEFLIRAADYYGVSIDYLLGRTSSTSGAVVQEQELPDNNVSEKYDGSIAGAATFFRKKVITNSLDVIFSLLIKTKNTELANAVCSYLSTAVYRSFRMVYSAGGNNDENSFAIPVEKVSGLTSAAMSLDDVKARAAASGEAASDDEKITNARIEQEYAKQSAALFSVVNSTEKLLEKLGE